MRISLKAARVNAGLTQQEAAEKCGIPIRVLRKGETDVSSLNVAHFFALCREYGVDPDDIFLSKLSAKADKSRLKSATAYRITHKEAK